MHSGSGRRRRGSGRSRCPDGCVSRMWLLGRVWARGLGEGHGREGRRRRGRQVFPLWRIGRVTAGRPGAPRGCVAARGPRLVLLGKREKKEGMGFYMLIEVKAKGEEKGDARVAGSLSLVRARWGQTKSLLGT
jgi:hypothetical protein